MHSKYITVALLNFNQACLLKRSITAIKNQTLKPYELIIGDDCSQDDSLEIIEHYKMHDSWIKSMHNKTNLGVVANANSLLKYVKTKYVLFAAADDFLLPDYIERAEKIIKNNSETGVITATALTFNKDKGSSGFYSSTFVSINSKFLDPKKFIKKLKHFGSFIKGATSIYKTEALKDLNGLDPNFFSFCDSYVAIQLSLKYGCFFDPCPGAVCERFATGYASSTMRDIDIIKKIINYLITKKEELPFAVYRSLSNKFISRLMSLIYFENNKKLFPENCSKLPPKDFSKLISIYFFMKEKNPIFFLNLIIIKYKQKIFLKISSFLLKKKIKEYNRYILDLNKLVERK